VGIDGVDEEWKDGVDPLHPGDPAAHVRTPAQPVFWPLEKHNGYRSDPRLADARERLLGLLAAPPPSPPSSPPPPTGAEFPVAAPPAPRASAPDPTTGRSG